MRKQRKPPRGQKPQNESPEEVELRLNKAGELLGLIMPPGWALKKRTHHHSQPTPINFDEYETYKPDYPEK